MQNSPLGAGFHTDIKVDSFTVHPLNVRIEKVRALKYSDAKGSDAEGPGFKMLIFN
jgi:hypothetical protein